MSLANRIRSERSILLAFALLAAAFTSHPVAAQEAVRGVPTQARLAYSEEVGRLETAPETDCSGSNMADEVECVAKRIEAENRSDSFKQLADASATFVVQSRLTILADGTHLVRIDATGGQPVIMGAMPETSSQAVRQDAELVRERLAAWRYSLNAGEVAELEARSKLTLDVVRPFEGLQKLMLQGPVAIMVTLQDVPQPEELEIEEGES